MRRRSYLSAREKSILRSATREEVEVRGDYERRFGNALLALVLSDPGWMVWVEENLPRALVRCWCPRRVMLLEAYTRAKFLKPHGYFYRARIGDLIFRQDWTFTDRGTLSPG